MAFVARLLQGGTKTFMNQSALTFIRCFGTTGKPLAVKIGSPAPNFRGTAVVDGQFKELSLGDFLSKYLVLFFYPLDFTFVCPTEIVAFHERMREFSCIDTNVVGVSTDSHFSHMAWTNTPRCDGGIGDVGFPLLSDFNKTISKDYGILVEDSGVALRASFIIDPKGIVRQITVNDLPVGRSVPEVLRLVKAFQLHDSQGALCPANWKPDMPFISPDVDEAKKFLKRELPRKSPGLTCPSPTSSSTCGL